VLFVAIIVARREARRSGSLSLGRVAAARQ